ncbi:MAG: hypothetical protein V1715_14460 [bacterium]
MKKIDLTQKDIELIQEAANTTDRLYLQGHHEVAGAIRTADDTLFTGIHIETQIDWADVCCEVAAMSCMVAGGHRDLETIVAVWKSPEEKHILLSPCGRCRELIYEFNKNAWVITGTMEKPFKVKAKDLLPLRTWDY